MKIIATILCTVLFAATLVTDTLAWGAITHAYFANELGYREGMPNAQEIYGSTLPDMFNLMYGSPYNEYLWMETHYGFMKVANRCSGRNLEAFAFGFASHNDDWGADLTAHRDARTMPGEGYVIAKVNELVPVLKPQLIDILTAAGVPDAATIADDAAPGLAENFVETAVDLLVKENEDPLIGYRLAIAAQLRDYRIPFRIYGAYAVDFADEFDIPLLEAATILLRAEKDCRDLMRTYGIIFTMEMSESISFLLQWGAGLAEEFLKAETGMDIVVSPSILEDFLFDEVLPRIEPDYNAEIAATLTYLAGEMGAHGFGSSYALLPAGGESRPAIPGADGFRLHQNVPNPFNPITTIEYTLPGGARVRLAVFDVRGREVAVLVDGHQPKGTHRVTWNAAGLPSGIYFCRITAGAFTATRKMCLLR
jgi:hypothetical protein